MNSDTNRHYVRLKEMQMTATSEPSPIGAHFTDLDPPPAHRHDAAGTCCDRGAALAMQNLPSAADHYRAACHALARADSNGYDYAAASRLQESARLHVALAELATALWPAADMDLAMALEDNRTMTQELTRLLPVVHAARAFVAAGDGPGVSQVEYLGLCDAVKALDAA